MSSTIGGTVRLSIGTTPFYATPLFRSLKPRDPRLRQKIERQVFGNFRPRAGKIGALATIRAPNHRGWGWSGVALDSCLGGPNRGCPGPEFSQITRASTPEPSGLGVVG
eukprot:7634299-Pyramimonas_sp.AAC.1